jgi:hypothetical protein
MSSIRRKYLPNSSSNSDIADISKNNWTRSLLMCCLKLFKCGRSSFKRRLKRMLNRVIANSHVIIFLYLSIRVDYEKPISTSPSVICGSISLRGNLEMMWHMILNIDYRTRSLSVSSFSSSFSYSYCFIAWICIKWFQIVFKNWAS